MWKGLSVFDMDQYFINIYHLPVFILLRIYEYILYRIDLVGKRCMTDEDIHLVHNNW